VRKRNTKAASQQEAAFSFSGGNMGRIRGVLRWDAFQNFGWVITEGGQVFHVRVKNFRKLPTVQLRDGMVVEFSKPTVNVEFLERLFAGKERDTFSGSHRNPRSKPDSRKNPLANNIVILEEGGPSHVQVTTAIES
jgi:hypothetical protein